MYRIWSEKQLWWLTALVCAIVLTAAFLRAAAPAIAASAFSGTAVPAVMYHQISENRSLWGQYVIPESVLQEDLQYLEENGFTPVSVDTLLAYVNKQGTLPEKPILLTFDDGERSFLTKVLPLLEQHGYPAVVSVVGQLVKLYTENGETDDRYAYLNENDLLFLAENPLIEIGNHSYNLHSLGKRRGLGRMPGEPENDYLSLVKADLTQLQDMLFSLTGRTPRLLAYPYGIRNDSLLALAKSMGFSVTLSCREAVNLLSAGDTLYELGRFNRPYGVSSAAFFGRFSRESPQKS